MDEAMELVGDNNVMKAAEGDLEALGGMFLESGGPFRMTPPEAGVYGALARAAIELERAGESLERYTLVASMVTGPSEATGAVWAVASIPLQGPLAAALAVMVEQGVLEKDTKRLKTAMMAGTPGVDSLCAMARELLAGSSLAVAGAYQDMSARLMRRIVSEGSPEHLVRELLALNARVGGVMDGLRRADSCWGIMADAHRETAIALGGNGASVSLAELLERMRELEERSD